MTVLADHVGPWTVDGVLALPEDTHHRIELPAGSLLLSPHPDVPHQRAGSRLARLLAAAVDAAGVPFEVLAAVNVLVPDGLLIPDLVVADAAAAAAAGTTLSARDIVVAIEIASPSTRVTDKKMKPSIPAGAGSSRSDKKGQCAGRDHPRGRGEQRTSSRGPRGMAGPSPRARGAAWCVQRQARRAGTIPAGAGSRMLMRLPSLPDGDHPRGRGEQTAGMSKITGKYGTIPAGAGSSRQAPDRGPGRWDHPRGRGEQSTANPTDANTAGPSPRARGAVTDMSPYSCRLGTIPAGAGSSPTRSTTSSGRRDHPRGRGEQDPREGGRCRT